MATDAPLTEPDLLDEIGTADYRYESATMVVTGGTGHGADREIAPALSGSAAAPGMASNSLT